MNKIIDSLYEQYKNTPRKLKIICYWDEVIQACEPYACYLELTENGKTYMSTFESYFTNRFWSDNKNHTYLGEPRTITEYSAYGSRLKAGMDFGFGVFYDRKDKKTLLERKDSLEKQQQIKNSPNFYQEAPFLSIADDLLKLIKEDKVEEILFLSNYSCSEKFSIFKTTFANLAKHWEAISGTFPDCHYKSSEGNGKVESIVFRFLSFKNEKQGLSKIDVVKRKYGDFDIFIDDNPIICKDVIESIPNFINPKFQDTCEVCRDVITIKTVGGYEMFNNNRKGIYAPICQKKECQEKTYDFKTIEEIREMNDGVEEKYWEIDKNELNEIKNDSKSILVEKNMMVFAPHYPSIESQHHKDVILLETSVSSLKKEDFLK